MTREQYKSLQLVQLKELAKSRGLKHISTLKKDELIDRMLEEDARESEEKETAEPEEAQAAENAAELPIRAPEAILMEASTGTVLYEKNADEARNPASVTKIMTLLLAMEAIDSGALRYEDTVTASPHACSMGGSQIWL
ncbi:MAG: D-alanyl-D-alanine carboxypeptidase, partial [Lachnospiraceae bacterium]|nr:D-alanyl-D-alanine carboxypeptidase [Lachnospiraceae bacterium]